MNLIRRFRQRDNYAEEYAAQALGVSEHVQRLAQTVDEVLARELTLPQKQIVYGRVTPLKVPAAQVYPWSAQIQRPEIAAKETAFGVRLPIARVKMSDGSLISHRKVVAAAEAVGNALGVQVSVEPTPGGGPLQYWIPKAEPDPTFWINMIQNMDAGLPPMHAVAGLDRLEQPVVLNLANGIDVHIAILGPTQAGKSRLADMLLLSLLLHTGPEVVRLAVFDCKYSFHERWQELPHSFIYAGGGEINHKKILSQVVRLHDLVAWRLAHKITTDRGRVGTPEHPYLLALFDDGREPEEWDRDYREIMGRLLRLGAAAGLRVIITAHDLREDYFGDASRTNLNTRIVSSGDVTKTAAQIGRGGSGAHDLNQEQRQFAMKRNNQVTVLYQPHLCMKGQHLDINQNNRDDVEEVIVALRQRHGRWNRFNWPPELAAGQPKPETKIVQLPTPPQRTCKGVAFEQAVQIAQQAVQQMSAQGMTHIAQADLAQAIWGSRTTSGQHQVAFLRDVYEIVMQNGNKQKEAAQ